MPPTDRWDLDDVIAADHEARSYPKIDVSFGLALMHRASGTQGTVVAFAQGQRVVLEDPAGGTHEFKPFDGAFAHNGRAVSLRGTVVAPASQERRFTASGSIDVGDAPARVAAGSRIWVEGVHDAELIERIWGDDLRVEGVVVEPMHGVDDLPALVAGFRPGPRQRLGILLDHLVEGSKESIMASRVTGPHVLVTGHPYVDIWQAVRPSALGIDRWPSVPKGRPWKEGIVDALGVPASSGEFWKQVLSCVESYRDVETPLVNAVERLIDFVAP